VAVKSYTTYNTEAEGGCQGERRCAKVFSWGKVLLGASKGKKRTARSFLTMIEKSGCKCVAESSIQGGGRTVSPVGGLKMLARSKKIVQRSVRGGEPKREVQHDYGCLGRDD